MSNAKLSTDRSTTTTTSMAARASGKATLFQLSSPLRECEPNLGEDTPVETPACRIQRASSGCVPTTRRRLPWTGRTPTSSGRWVVDPGPALPSHLDAVRRAVPNDGIEGVVLTHSHADHAEAAELFDAPVTLPSDGESVGPFTAIGTPGHSADSVCLLLGRTCFTGDTVLGEGSVFIAPGEGSLSAYLDSLRRLRSLDLTVLCPGTARTCGTRPRNSTSTSRTAWTANDGWSRRWSRDCAPKKSCWTRRGRRCRGQLRPAAALTLRAHLEKLGDEGRLPPGVGGGAGERRH